MSFENVSMDLVLFVLGQLIVAAAIWGGIRAEIKNMHRRVDTQESATKDAHTRIDQLFQAYWQKTHNHTPNGL